MPLSECLFELAMEKIRWTERCRGILRPFHCRMIDKRRMKGNRANDSRDTSSSSNGLSELMIQLLATLSLRKDGKEILNSCYAPLTAGNI